MMTIRTYCQITYLAFLLAMLYAPATSAETKNFTVDLSMPGIADAEAILGHFEIEATHLTGKGRETFSEHQSGPSPTGRLVSFHLEVMLNGRRRQLDLLDSALASPLVIFQNGEFAAVSFIDSSNQAAERKTSSYQAAPAPQQDDRWVVDIAPAAGGNAAVLSALIAHMKETGGTSALMSPTMLAVIGGGLMLIGSIFLYRRRRHEVAKINPPQ